MSDHLTQQQIASITGVVRQYAQERRLREMGYIVLTRNAKNEVQALATHPQDPALKAAERRGEVVRLHL
jgi:hypothetical protein